MPGRWSQYDSVEYRTGGMECVGYDADTRRYYFQDETGLYEGEPGAEYGGRMRRIGRAPPRPPPVVNASKKRSTKEKEASDSTEGSGSSFRPLQILGTLKRASRKLRAASESELVSSPSISSPVPGNDPDKPSTGPSSYKPKEASETKVISPSSNSPTLSNPSPPKTSSHKPKQAIDTEIDQSSPRPPPTPVKDYDPSPSRRPSSHKPKETSAAWITSVSSHSPPSDLPSPRPSSHQPEPKVTSGLVDVSSPKSSSHKRRAASETGPVLASSSVSPRRHATDTQTGSISSSRLPPPTPEKDFDAPFPKPSSHKPPKKESETTVVPVSSQSPASDLNSPESSSHKEEMSEAKVSAPAPAPAPSNPSSSKSTSHRPGAASESKLVLAPSSEPSRRHATDAQTGRISPSGTPPPTPAKDFDIHTRGLSSHKPKEASETKIVPVSSQPPPSHSTPKPSSQRPVEVGEAKVVSAPSRSPPSNPPRSKSASHRPRAASESRVSAPPVIVNVLRRLSHQAKVPNAAKVTTAPSSHQPPPLPAKDREPSLSSPTPSAFKPPTSAAPKPKEKVEEGAPKGDAEDHGWKSLVPVAAVSEMIGRVRYRASILRASKDEKQEKAKEASTPDQ